MPITNRFAKVKVELFSSRVAGVFEGKDVSKMLAHFFFPIPFLNQAPYNKEDHQHRLEIALKEE